MADPVTDIANAFDLATVALKTATDTINLATQQSQLLTVAQSSQVASLMAQTTAMDSATGSAIGALYTVSGALAAAAAQSRALVAAQAAIITQLSGANAGAGIYGPATFGLQLFTRAVNDAAVAAWNFTQAANNNPNQPKPPKTPGGAGAKGPGDALIDAAQKAAAQFDVIKNAVLGAVHSASPVAWDTLSKSFTILGAQIGKSFIPYVIEAAGWLQKGADYVATMDSATKSSIAKWVEYGVVVLAAGKGISIILSLLTPLAVGLRLVGASLAFLVANPILAGLGAIAAGLGYIAYQANQARAAVDNMIQRLDSYKDDLSRSQLTLSPEYKKIAGGKTPEEQKAIGQKELEESMKNEQEKAKKLAEVQQANTSIASQWWNKSDIEKAANEFEEASKRVQRAQAAYNELVKGNKFAPGPGGAALDAKVAAQKSGGGKGPSVDISHELQPQYFTDFAQARKAIELASVGKSDLDRQILQAQRDGNQLAKQTATHLQNIDNKTPPIAGPKPKPTNIGGGP